MEARKLREGGERVQVPSRYIYMSDDKLMAAFGWMIGYGGPVLWQQS